MLYDLQLRLLKRGLVILDRPFIAVLLGLITGVVMAAVAFFIPKLEKTGDPLKRWPWMIGGNIVSLLLGMGAIFGYNLLAHHSLVWFGLATIACFMIALIVSALPGIRQMKRRS